MVDTALVAGSAKLAGWVREHHVTWESSSRRETAAVPGAPGPLVVTLNGRYPGGHFPAGDEGFDLVFDRLRAIALHVLESLPGARYRIDPFDAAVRLRPEAHWVPEVELSFVLETDDDPGGPNDRSGLLDRVGSGLDGLGVRRKRWGDGKEGSP